MVCLQLVLLYRKYQAIERAQIDGMLINYGSTQKTPEEWLRGLCGWVRHWLGDGLETAA